MGGSVTSRAHHMRNRGDDRWPVEQVNFVARSRNYRVA
jgi:hypothetical protein